MIINSVKLVNFRQFHGEQLITFATDRKKNVTLIHAENGVGKTALLNSIKWCLFKNVTPNFENPHDLLNHEAADKKNSRHLKVEVDFTITTGETYKAIRMLDKFSVYPVIDNFLGESMGDPQSQIFINTVLPPEMSDYFFFQGEGSSTLKKGKVSSTKSAIQDILGFRPATQAILDLESISKDYTKEISRLDNNGQSQNISNQIEKMVSRLEDEKSKLDNLEKNIETLESDIAKIDSELNGLDSAAVENLTRSRREQTKILKTKKEELSSIKKSKMLLIGKYGWSVFGKEFGEKIYDYIDESQFKGRLPEPYNKTLIDDILKEKECICGNSIEDGTDARARIINLLGKAVDPALQQRVFNIKSWAQQLSTDQTSAFTEIKKTIATEKKIHSDIETVERHLLEIEKSFDSFEGDPDSIADKARILAVSRREKDKALRLNHEKKGASLSSISAVNELLKKLKLEQSALSDNNEQIKQLLSQQRVTDEIIEEVKSVLEKTERDARSVLFKLVSDKIEEFLRNDYSVKLDSDFNVSLINNFNKKVNLSDGQKLLLNLIFTASLIKHAENRLNATSGVLLPGTTAPFVIDAPFGELDKTYRGHVARLLPSYSRQVVLFLSSSHWEGEVETNIRDHIGREYYIKLHESSERNGKQLDKIVVLGNEYILNEYESDISYSEIVEMEV
ncbi:AAA family ATPase [Vibrio parahaemolyticus]